MSSECEALINDIIQFGEKQNLKCLKDKVIEAPINLLNEAIRKEIHHSTGINFWQYLLRGFSLEESQETKTKRYCCVKTFLNELSSIELSYKLTSDLITRLCADLNTFTIEQLVEIIEFAVDFLRKGDSKCVGWKDLLPEALLILSNQSVICVNDMKTTGSEYRATVIKNLCSMKWPLAVFTPIANMFVDLKLTNEEISTVLKKFSRNILSLAPLELPSLAFQLFTLGQNASHIILMILAFERYFYKYYYKKLFSDMDSNTTDFNSIDQYSDKELREAEETILHHLSYCTKFIINEQQMTIALRNISSSTELILTPFVISAILSMTTINRDPDDSNLSSSNLLTFLKSVIKINEDEKQLSKYSLWSRDVSQTTTIDVDQVFLVLIDQNKEGKDVITPGLVNLAFVCLKANDSPVLNGIGKNFLQKFIKKRFIFGQGIIKKLADWMILEQDAVQYSECLTSFGYIDSYTVSECVTTIKYVLDFFLLIPGINAMRMIAFILPVLKISTRIRDLLIEMLTKAINSKDLNTMRLGVYGFCMLLKHLNNNNSQRANNVGNLTQYNISGFSFMTQASLKNSANNPQRHFDTMTLQIIGYLRKCFNAPLEVKKTLYENLLRAIELNSKLSPHILEFVEHHFRSHFEISDSECKILFHKLMNINDENENDVEIVENLGELVNLVSFAVVTCERNHLNYDTVVIKSILKTLIEKICEREIQMIDMKNSLDRSKGYLAVLQLNFLESLMSFTIWTSTLSNQNIEKIDKLFKEHKILLDGLKNYSQSAKKSKKTNNDTISQTSGILMKSITHKVENIWDLPTIERFLKLIFDDVVSFAEPSKTTSLRANRDFVNYVLEVTSFHIELTRNQPDYKQINHSRRVLKNIIEITKILYEKVVKKLQNLWSNFSLRSTYLGVNCFYQSLKTAQAVFHRKFNLFLKGIDIPFAINDKDNIIITVQSIFEESLKDYEELQEDCNARNVPTILLNCLEILYDFLPYENSIVRETFIWLNNICKNYEINSKELSSVLHKLLFSQRLKTHTSGIFFIHICQQLERVSGQIETETYDSDCTELKSISESTAEPVSICLINTFQKQLADIEFFIQKCKCSLNKLKIMPNEYQDESTTELKSMERSINRQLIDLSNQLYHIINIQSSLGNCMIALIKFLINFYNCLTNLTKHFINRNTIQGIKFDQVIRIAGKSLSTRVYNLITYIDKKHDIIATAQKKSNALVDRAKVLRETKFLPKLILRLENFNKFVFLLSKKVPEEDLSKLLHMGTVRDYRIKTDNLREAINQTLDNANKIDDDNNDDDDKNEDDKDEDDKDEDESGNKANEQIENDNNNDNSEETDTENLTSESSSTVLNNESNRKTTSQFLKNTRTINEKQSRKRKSTTADNSTNSPIELVGKRKTRSSSKCIDPPPEVEAKKTRRSKR